MDPMQRFTNACADKYDAGIKEHREGDPTRPFQGNVFSEYAAEQLDSANYLLEMLLTQRISQAEYDHGMQLHFQAWWWVKQRQTGETL